MPAVFQLTSCVEGRLADGKDRIDLLEACFPGGSITGAPKIRAMEIIDELEPTTQKHLHRLHRLPELQRRDGPQYRHPHHPGQE